MSFKIGGKVALITGGASGIGLRYAKELLRNGLKNVTLADSNPKFGEEALNEIEQEFGPKKAIFAKTDVTLKEEFEESFKKTIGSFGQLDILINNAAVMNDSIWEKQILINMNGTTHGILLGLEKYLPKYHTGEEGLIVNMSSIAGVTATAMFPIYAGTKHAVVGMTRSWADPRIYDRTKVRVIAICPGMTMTPLITELHGRTLGEEYEKFPTDVYVPQSPEYIATEAMDVIKYAPNGSTWVIEAGEPAYEFVFPERETMKQNVLKKS